MTVRPLKDRILVKRIDSETQTAGGIIIPDTAQEKPMEGVVISKGNASLLSEGDTVLFAKYAGTEIEIEDQPHLILSEEEVLAVIN